MPMNEEVSELTTSLYQRAQRGDFMGALLLAADEYLDVLKLGV